MYRVRKAQVSTGVATGCRRLHSDLPAGLYDLLEAAAKEPPAISVAEFSRRLIALHFDYDLPRASERERLGIRVTGAKKIKPGRKKKGSDVSVPGA